MTRRLTLLGLALLVVPALVRGLWFYQGVYWRRSPVSTPEYASFTVPLPPLSTAEAPAARNASPGAHVLVDQSHANNFLAAELEPLLREVSAHGGQVEFLTSSDSGSLATRLAAATALVVAAPNAPFMRDEVQRIEAFVGRGGRVLVLTDPTRGSPQYDSYYSDTSTPLDDSSAANTLLAPFEITVADDYLYNLNENEGNFRNVLLTHFAASPLTADLGRVAFYAAHSIASPTGLALIYADENTLTSRTDRGGDLAAAVLAANERVLVIGDLTFLAPPYDHVADNARWISNLASFLLGGEPSRAPTDFPYIFSGPVVVQALGELEMSTDLITALSSLQSALDESGLALTISESPKATANRIVLATYADQEELSPFLGGFEIGLPGADGDPLGTGELQLPGWRTLDASAVGLMLVARNEGQTTLTLIGADASALIELISALATHDFSMCIGQEGIAACATGPADLASLDFAFADNDFTALDGGLP
ncbi:MAG: hypothetical protein A2Z30_04095 [Chloroflexi bacterium RBG_16_64_43]|nr:MAG: hypothetical protein A2Z30_04095 [Chloroflexi bacterium RBG_16_64_43]